MEVAGPFLEQQPAPGQIRPENEAGQPGQNWPALYYRSLQNMVSVMRPCFCTLTIKIWLSSFLGLLLTLPLALKLGWC